MNWTLSNPVLKTALFRFVEVFPDLRTKADISIFLKEYLLHNKDLTRQSSFWLKIAFFSLRLLPTFFLCALASKYMKKTARRFIIKEDGPSILQALKKIRNSDQAFTVDLLGEAVLSPAEALQCHRRYQNIIEHLHQQEWVKNPLTDEDENKQDIPILNVSVKVSSLDSQIWTVAYEESKNRIKCKLRPLFRKAIEQSAFINVDIEQYEFKDLFLSAFEELILEPEFENYPHFGMALQAYLISALKDIEKLCACVKRRATPITIRLVKGAYWDYERIQSSQKNWPCPVFLSKPESDKNFLACAEQILKNYPHLRLAIGSHNIQSVIYVLCLAQKLGIPKKAVEVQTLYGMAENLSQCLSHKGWRVRRYCPVGSPIPGMAYLVRRLLENTANESALHFRESKNNIEKLMDALLQPSSLRKT